MAVVPIVVVTALDTPFVCPDAVAVTVVLSKPLVCDAFADTLHPSRRINREYPDRTCEIQLCLGQLDRSQQQIGR
jgi:hypothetical protein